MIKPVRLQLSRRKGFNLQQLSRDTNGLEVVNVARPSKWGNPYPVGSVIGALPDGTLVKRDAARAVKDFREYLRHWMWKASENALTPSELRGKNLACWCNIHVNGNPVPCHADVLLSLANAIPIEEVIRENLRWAKGETL